MWRLLFAVCFGASQVAIEWCRSSGCEVNLSLKAFAQCEITAIFTGSLSVTQSEVAPTKPLKQSVWKISIFISNIAFTAEYFSFKQQQAVKLALPCCRWFVSLKRSQKLSLKCYLKLLTDIKLESGFKSAVKVFEAAQTTKSFELNANASILKSH